MRMEDDAGNRDYTHKRIDGTNARVSVSESIKNFPKSDCYVVGVFQTTLPRKFWARMFTNSWSLVIIPVLWCKHPVISMACWIIPIQAWLLCPNYPGQGAPLELDPSLQCSPRGAQASIHLCPNSDPPRKGQRYTLQTQQRLAYFSVTSTAAPGSWKQELLLAKAAVKPQKQFLKKTSQ